MNVLFLLTGPVFSFLSIVKNLKVVAGSVHPEAIYFKNKPALRRVGVAQSV
jgi:hypothetical protein